MGNKHAQGRLSARRMAAFLAALGALVMSSGIALMVAATPANAKEVQHVPVGVCHATSSDTNPYVFLVVDDDSTKLQGHLMHRNDPNKKWKSAGTWNGISHVKGDPKPDYIATYTGTDGVTHQLDGDVTANSCPGVTEEPQDVTATANVTFTDPSCETPAGADFSPSGEHVTFDVVSGSKAPDTTIVVRAYADDNASFADGSNFKDFEHYYPALDNCEGDGPKLLTPQAPTFTEPTCTTDPSVTLPSAPALSRVAAGSLPESVDVNGVRYTASGALVPGGTVTVDATLLGEGTTFGDAKHHWSYTFTTPTGCTQVSPPTEGQTEGQVVVNTPKTKTTKTKSTVTPTVVEAGLVGTSAPDLRGEQGLALMVAGMVMLVAAGGLGLRVRGAAARI